MEQVLILVYFFCGVATAIAHYVEYRDIEVESTIYFYIALFWPLTLMVKGLMFLIETIGDFTIKKLDKR